MYAWNINFSNRVKNKENCSKILVCIVKKFYTQDVSAVALTDILPGIALLPSHSIQVGSLVSFNAFGLLLETTKEVTLYPGAGPNFMELLSTQIFLLA